MRKAKVESGEGLVWERDNVGRIGDGMCWIARVGGVKSGLMAVVRGDAVQEKESYLGVHSDVV